MINNMTAHEVQQDAIYAEAYARASKAFDKKYQKLLKAAQAWMSVYDTAFGEPEKCPEYYALKKIINT